MWYPICFNMHRKINTTKLSNSKESEKKKHDPYCSEPKTIDILPPTPAPFHRREQHFRVSNCSLPYIWGSCRGNDRVNTDYQKLRLSLSPFLFPVFCACVVALPAWVFFYSSFNVLYLGAHTLLGKIMNTNLKSRSFTSPALLTMTSPECLMLDSNAKVQQNVAREATSTRMWDCKR